MGDGATNPHANSLGTSRIRQASIRTMIGAMDAWLLRWTGGCVLGSLQGCPDE